MGRTFGFVWERLPEINRELGIILPDRALVLLHIQVTVPEV